MRADHVFGRHPGRIGHRFQIRGEGGVIANLDDAFLSLLIRSDRIGKHTFYLALNRAVIGRLGIEIHQQIDQRGHPFDHPGGCGLRQSRIEGEDFRAHLVPDLGPKTDEQRVIGHGAVSRPAAHARNGASVMPLADRASRMLRAVSTAAGLSPCTQIE